MKRRVKKARGYIRVSSTDQAEKKTYRSQKRNLDRFFESREDLEQDQTYIDKGISGRSVDKRTAFQQCMADAASGDFDVLVVDSLSRFGRNAREILNNAEYLKKHTVEFISIKDNIDMTNPYGKMQLTMMAGFAELESDMIGERSMDGRLRKARDENKPTGGKLPYGRKYDKETDEWSLVPKKAKLARWAAEQILKGTPVVEVSDILRKKHGKPLSKNHLRRVLTDLAGTTYRINFRKGKEPVTLQVPRLLDEATIIALKEQFKRNFQFNRTDVGSKYLLNPYMRCARCGRAVHGWIDKKKNKEGILIAENLRYSHPGGRRIKCRRRFHLDLRETESMIFDSLYEFTFDRVGFLDAVESQIPNDTQIKSLQDAIALDSATFFL